MDPQAGPLAAGEALGVGDEAAVEERPREARVDALRGGCVVRYHYHRPGVRLGERALEPARVQGEDVRRVLRREGRLAQTDARGVVHEAPRLGHRRLALLADDAEAAPGRGPEEPYPVYHRRLRIEHPDRRADAKAQQLRDGVDERPAIEFVVPR